MYLRPLAHVLLYRPTSSSHDDAPDRRQSPKYYGSVSPVRASPLSYLFLSLYHQPSSSPRFLLLCFSYSYSCRDRVFASHPPAPPPPRTSLIASPTQPGRIHCRHPSRLSTPSRLFTYTRAHPHPSHPLHLELAHSRRAYPWQPRSGFTPPPSCSSPSTLIPTTSTHTIYAPAPPDFLISLTRRMFC